MSDKDTNSSTESLWTSIRQYRKNLNNSKQSMGLFTNINSQANQINTQMNFLSQVDNDKSPSSTTSSQTSVNGYLNKSFETTIRRKIGGQDESKANYFIQNNSQNITRPSSHNQTIVNVAEDSEEKDKTAIEIKGISKSVNSNSVDSYECNCEFVREELEKIKDELSKLKDLIDEKDIKIIQLENVKLDIVN